MLFPTRFFELSEPDKALTPNQIKIIQNHLKLVFLYEIDPSYSDNKVVQQIFQNIHDGKDPLKGIQGVSFTGPVDKPSYPDRILKC